MSVLRAVSASRAGRLASWGQVRAPLGTTTSRRSVVSRRGGPVRGRRGTAPCAAFLTSVTHVASAVRSGSGPAEAWWHGMEVRTEGGVPHWADLVARCGPDERAAAGAVRAAACLSAEVGTAQAAMLDRVVAALERDADAATQRQAAIAGPRATARLLTWLPALGLALGLALGADPAAVLLDGGGGTGLLVAGCALTVGGHRWGAR